MGRVIGCDLTDLYCQVSISIESGETEEVRSVPAIAGSEKYVIPVAAHIGIGGELTYGEDAVKFSRDDGRLVTNLLSRAEKGERVRIGDYSYEVRKLLEGFIKRTLYLTSVISPLEQVSRVVIAIPDVSERMVETLEDAVSFLHEAGKEFRIMGYPECFFYYAMNQDPVLTKNKVALFDYDGDTVRSMLLYTRVDMRPHLSMVEERVFDMAMKDDLCFLEVARSVLDSEIVSAVYLSGEGFEGGWLDKSVSYLCERKRRVFQGRNLYTKGACYAGIDDRDGNPTLDNCRFFDDGKVSSSVGLHMVRDGQETYVPLIDAGTNWYEAKGVGEFYLGEDREIRIRLESFFTKDVRYTVLRCDGFPKRPAGCTRVRLEVSLRDPSVIECTAYDLGFGDIFKSAGDKVFTEITI